VEGKAATERTDHRSRVRNATEKEWLLTLSAGTGTLSGTAAALPYVAEATVLILQVTINCSVSGKKT